MPNFSQDLEAPPTDLTSEIESHKVHELKCWPKFFEAIQAGKKKHDLRRADDRNFAVGDLIILCEFDPQTCQYTRRRQKVEITFVTSAEDPCALSDQALHPAFCILSIELLQE